MDQSEWDKLSPFQKLLRSRKFLILGLDTVVSIILWVAASYGNPELQEGVKFFVLVLQAPVILVIGSIAYEDGKRISNGG